VELCTHAGDESTLDPAAKLRLEERFQTWTAGGIRVVAVAWRTVRPAPPYSRELEHDLTFAGFLTLLDAPKEDAAEAIRGLA
jgi:Mg2+-importing ATPase